MDRSIKSRRAGPGIVGCLSIAWKSAMPRLVLAAGLLSAPVVATARSSPAPVGVVSAADPRAAAAGVEILRRGGTAADAAVATMLALNVVEPMHSGVGGGGFFMHHDARTGQLDGFDGRETAPAAADPHWFYGPDGKPLSFPQAVPGGRSFGVPGNLRLMALAHDRYGHLGWKALFEPAIRLARDGFRVTPRLHRYLQLYAGLTHLAPGTLSPWARAHFYDPSGAPAAVGTRLKNPAQAALLRRIAAQGPAVFYTGPLARQIVEAANTAIRNPSRLTLADLSGYRAEERPPVCGAYRQYRICGMGPPSAGGISVFQILKQLERFDLAAMGPSSPVAWHLFAESSRLAYADRDAYITDPAFVTVPVAGLIAPDYLAARSALISPDRSMTIVKAGTPAGTPRATAAGVAGPEHGTSDIAVVDAKGDVAEVTTTINFLFGSGMSVEGTMLNDELNDFDTVPDKNGVPVANRVEGGKRPRSSMSPTIVYGPDGQVRVAIGAAGGGTIIAQVAKALIGIIDWRLTAQQAIALPLLYAPDQTARLEKGTTLEAMAPRLAALGEKVRVDVMGLKANAIERVDGKWVGAADPRSEGVSHTTTGNVVAPERVAIPEGAPSE